MKRTISLFFTLILLFSISAVAFDVQEDTKEEYSGAIEKMLALGIMEGYIESETYEFMPDKEASRVEFYVSLVKAMRGNDGFVNSNIKTPFVDLTQSHWAAGYINEANALNILIEEGNLYPEESIRMTDALAILLNVTGYKPYAEMKGGNPNGYIRVANEIGITKGVNAHYNSFLTRGQVAQLLSNTIDISVMDVDAFVGNDATYSILEGTTIVSRGRGIYKSQGRVVADEFTSINGTGATEVGLVKIEDEIYEIGASGISDALGMYVEFYYEDDDNTILHYVIKDGKNTKTIIYADDILNVSKSKIDYYENNKSKTISIAENANVIYNGKYFSKAINVNELLLNPKEGYIELISYGNDKVIDLVMIHDVQTYVVKEIFPQNLLINDFNDKDPLYLTEDDDYVVEKNGERIQFNQITAFDVISVEKSYDSSLYTMTVSSNKIAGAVEMVGDDSVIIGDVEYPINGDEISKVILGKEGIFYIDNFGKIAACSYSSGITGSYGYIVKAASDKKISSDTAHLRIYTSTEDFINYECAEKVYVDGYKISKGSEVITKLNLSGVDAYDKYSSGVCQLVRYTLNENGQIYNIDTVQENKIPLESDLTCFAPMTARSSDAKGAFGGTDVSLNRFYVNDSTVIFDIPGDKTNEDYFDIKTPGFFVVDQSYDIEGYDATELCMASACVTDTGGSEGAPSLAEHDAIIEIVSKKYVARMDDGEYVNVLCTVLGPKENIYYIQDKTKYVLVRNNEVEINYDNIRPGDIVSVSADGKKKAQYIYKIFPDNGSVLVKDIDNYLYSYGSYQEYILGYLEKKSGSGILLACGDRHIYCYLNSSTSYSKYSFEEKKGSSATKNDLIASSSEEGASKVFVRVRNGDVKNVIIFE